MSHSPISNVCDSLAEGRYPFEGKNHHVVVLLQEGVGIRKYNKSNPLLQSTQITLNFMEFLEYSWYVYIYYLISHNNLASHFSFPLYRWEN